MSALRAGAGGQVGRWAGQATQTSSAWCWGPACRRSALGPREKAALTLDPLGRKTLQATCRRTLEVMQMALLFLSSSLGTKR